MFQAPHLRQQSRRTCRPWSALDDRYMKKAVLRLYGAAKSPWEQAKDSSSVSSKGLVLWEGDEPFVPQKVTDLKAHCSR